MLRPLNCAFASADSMIDSMPSQAFAAYRPAAMPCLWPVSLLNRVCGIGLLSAIASVRIFFARSNGFPRIVLQISIDFFVDIDSAMPTLFAAFSFACAE